MLRWIVKPSLSFPFSFFFLIVSGDSHQFYYDSTADEYYKDQSFVTISIQTKYKNYLS